MSTFNFAVIGRRLATTLVLTGIVGCTQSLDPTPLSSGDAATCKNACAAHATPTCTSECESACSGSCTGSMSTSDFSSVDSIDCNQSGVTFHEGGSELTCFP